MPVRYHIDPAQRVVFVTYVEPVTTSEWTEALEAILVDPLYEREFGFVADRRGAAAPDPSFARQIVDFIELHRDRFGPRLKVAMVASEALAFGMARLQQILNERVRVESETFGDERAALRWLAAPSRSQDRPDPELP